MAPDSNLPHGLNDSNFTSKTNVAILSALNCPPAHIKYVERTTRILPHELYEAICLSNCYQAVMCCDLRNLDSLRSIDLVVPDLRLADLLKRCFLPDAQIAPITCAPLLEGDKAGRPKVHVSDAQRKRSERAIEVSKLIEELDALNESGKHLKDIGIKRTRDSLDIPIGERQGAAFNQESPAVFRCQFYGRQEAAHPTATETMSHAEFIDFLKMRHQLIFASKFDNQLVSAAFFDPNKSTQTNRGLDNVVHLNGIWLDNDGEGNLSVETFIAMFPRWEMYICNTYSSGKNSKRRWRAYIPSKYLMSINVHKRILQIIKTRLADKKFYGETYCKKNQDAKKHGFDETKFAATSLFYLPCQSAFADSFWIECIGNQRAMLNPYVEIDKNHVKQAPEAVVNELEQRREYNMAAGRVAGCVEIA